MIRTLIKGLLVLLVIVGIAPFILPLKEGRPLLSFSDIKPPPLPDLPKVKPPEAAIGSPAPPTPGKVEVYRWKDAQGKWVYSNEAPPPGVVHETIVADIAPAPSGRVAEPALSVPGGTPVQQNAGAQSAPTLPSPYSPERIRELVEDARGVQTLMDSRTQRLDGEL